MDSIDSFGDSDEECDPRIKIELESLNQAASDVNRLEKEINEARSKYQETFYECSQELEILRKKYGRKINKARAYYETKELSKEAQSEALLSARKFQSANGVYMAAKETISLAELRLNDDKAASLSPAWQEMLNHALIRVMESEQEKTKSEKEHLKKSAVFAETEKKLHILEKKHKKAIEKAKSYFDSKNELELRLQQIKLSIEDLQQAMLSAKSQYSTSLKNLEAISDGIHEARREKLIYMYPREPGVGAEEDTDTELKELPSLATSTSDFSLSCTSSVDDDKCFSDESDEAENENEHLENAISNIQSIDLQPNTTAPCIKNKRTTEKHIPIAKVKSKQKLKKTMSLDSYLVEEENLEVDLRSIEIETETVLLKMEASTSKNDYDQQNAINAKDLVCEDVSRARPKSGLLLLDPSALCWSDVVGDRADAVL